MQTDHRANVNNDTRTNVQLQFKIFNAAGLMFERK